MKTTPNIGFTMTGLAVIGFACGGECGDSCADQTPAVELHRLADPRPDLVDDGPTVVVSLDDLDIESFFDPASRYELHGFFQSTLTQDEVSLVMLEQGNPPPALNNDCHVRYEVEFAAGEPLGIHLRIRSSCRHRISRDFAHLRAMLGGPQADAD